MASGGSAVNEVINFRCPGDLAARLNKFTTERSELPPITAPMVAEAIAEAVMARGPVLHRDAPKVLAFINAAKQLTKIRGRSAVRGVTRTDVMRLAMQLGLDALDKLEVPKAPKPAPTRQRLETLEDIIAATGEMDEHRYAYALLFGPSGRKKTPPK